MISRWICEGDCMDMRETCGNGPEDWMIAKYRSGFLQDKLARESGEVSQNACRR